MSESVELSAATKGLLRDGPALMLVTDPSVPDLDDRLDDAIAGGARCVQYRDKQAPAAARADWVDGFQSRHPGAIVLVNDDLGTRGDGLHMSSGYQSLSDARVALSWRPLIGRSVRPGYREPDRDYRPGVDYVVFGTVFRSESHPGGPVAGLDALAEACRDTSAWGVPFSYTPAGKYGARIAYHEEIPLPVLAIGGITAENAGDCIRAGAAGVAVIRSVLMAKDPARAASEILQAMREATA